MKYITFPGPAYKTVLTRVAVEQSLITPPIVAIFFGSQALMEGKGWEVAKLRVEEVRSMVQLVTPVRQKIINWFRDDNRNGGLHR